MKKQNQFAPTPKGVICRHNPKGRKLFQSPFRDLGHLLFWLFLLPLGPGLLLAQRVGINSTGALPNTSALLDVDAAPGNNKGMLIPRIPLQSTTDAVTIPTPAISLLVYNSNPAMIGGALGYWYWDGTQWVQLATAGSSNAWLLLGNLNTVDGTNFLGTKDNVPLSFRVNNQKAGRIENNVATANTFFGYHAGNALTTGTNNTATGYQALRSNTSGHYNTANGVDALSSNTLGVANTATGSNALYSNISGGSNTANGMNALYSNNTGGSNTANGTSTLQANTDGYNNTATGSNALYENISGYNNTANGVSALRKNTLGNYNTAIGSQALYFNITGYSNIAVGTHALYNNTDRSNLIAIGDSALYNNGLGSAAATEAIHNTAIGSKALYSNTKGSYNTANGYQALYSNTTAHNNTAIGYQALYTQSFSNGGAAWSSNNVAIGHYALFANQPTATSFSGSLNTAVGNYAMRYNITGERNTATGYQALYKNTTGFENTAYGAVALYENTTGEENTALGEGVLYANTIGERNTASGYQALFYNVTGERNTAVGYLAGYSVIFNSISNNSLFGYQAGTSLITGGNNNILIGYQAGGAITTGANNIVLGYNIDAPSATGSNQLSIGNLIFGTGINGAGTTVSTGNIGIATASPNSTFEVSGSLGNSKRTAITAAYAVAATDFYIGFTGANSTYTITLPAAAASNAGRIYIIKREDIWTSGTVTLNGGGTNIDGAASTTTSINSSYGSLRIISTGSAWFTF